MNDGDEEQLAISVIAKLTDLEKQMAKANKITARAYREMTLSSRKATKQMEDDAIRSSARISQAMATVGTKIGAYGKAFAGGLVGSIVGAGITGVIANVRQVAAGVAEIGDQAKIAGVSVKAFQELKYVMEQNRIPVDALQDGLKELSLRADEFIVSAGKSGSGAEAFQRLGYSVDDLKAKLKDPSALLAEIIGRLQQLDKAAQIRIADEIFGGTGGERFVQLIDQGEAGIRNTIKAANDLGVVMDDQLIERAAEVDRRFNQIASTAGTALKSAIVSAADSLAEFIDGFRDFQNQQSGTLRNRMADLGMERLEIENRILALKEEQANNTSLLAQAENRATDAAIAGLKERSAALHEQEKQILAVLGPRNPPMARTAERTWTPPPPTPPATGSGSSSRAASAGQTERERQAVEDLIAALEEELRIAGLSDAEKRASIASRQAGTAATEEERQKIVALNEAIHQEGEARRRAEEQALYYRDLTRAGLDDLFDGLEQGRSFWEAMGDVAVNSLKRIADTMLDDVLDSIFMVNSAASGSSGGGFLSSLLGLGGGSWQFGAAQAGALKPGLFANGGAFGSSGVVPFAKGGAFTNTVVDRPTLFPFAKGTGLMGEAGPEAIMPLSRDASGRLGVSVAGGGAEGGGSPANVNLSYAPVYNVQGYGEDIAAMKRQIMVNDRLFSSRVVDTIRDARNRGVRI